MNQCESDNLPLITKLSFVLTKKECKPQKYPQKPCPPPKKPVPCPQSYCNESDWSELTIPDCEYPSRSCSEEEDFVSKAWLTTCDDLGGCK